MWSGTSTISKRPGNIRAAMQDRLGLMEQLGLGQSTGGEVNWADGRED